VIDHLADIFSHSSDGLKVWKYQTVCARKFQRAGDKFGMLCRGTADAKENGVCPRVWFEAWEGL
jgi:hypothetical protein